MAVASPLKNASSSVADFLVALMKIESTTKNEGALAFAIKEYLKSTGWSIINQPMPEEPARSNILATRSSKNCEPRILFNTHLDTVPPYIPPRKDDKNVYGRGSNDAKGQIASMIFALQRLIKEHPEYENDVGLLLVVGEETDHIGMKEANKLDLRPDYLIVGEPTELKFAHAQKGALKFKLVSKGVAAHSGYPEKGESAVHKLLDVLQDIRTHQWPSDPSLGESLT
ncbi:peptidase dimerization domain-containing protein [Aphelenchoides avenae]|nr:peptidase dimerization domain-containing protein [Aphelenchus avenae]